MKKYFVFMVLFLIGKAVFPQASTYLHNHNFNRGMVSPIFMCKDSTLTIMLDYERKLNSPKINSCQISLEKPISKKTDMGVYLIYDDFDWYYTHIYYTRLQENLINVSYKINYDLSKRWDIGAFAHYNNHNRIFESWNDATYYEKTKFNFNYFAAGIDIAYKTKRMVFGSGLKLYNSMSNNSLSNEVSIFHNYNFFVKNYYFNTLLNVNFYKYPRWGNINSFFTGLTIRKEKYTLGLSYYMDITLWYASIFQISIKKQFSDLFFTNLHYNIPTQRMFNNMDVFSSEKISFGIGFGFNL